MWTVVVESIDMRDILAVQELGYRSTQRRVKHRNDT